MSESDNSTNDKPKTPHARGSAIAGLALILALGSAGSSGWLWYTLAFRNADLYNQSIPERVEALRGELSKLDSLGQQNAKSIEQLANQQQVLVEATKKAYNQVSRSRNKWAVSEIEQLLIIANQRLQLAHDFETAAIALQAADSRLANLADPSLTPVRKRLARELAELGSYEQTDISGLSLRLAGLIDNVENLPLSLKVAYVKETAGSGSSKSSGRKQEPGGTAPPPESDGFIAELWHDITSLVQFRNNVDSYKPLLPPEQQYFLRENLRLLLLGAQQALLRNEREVYVHNLKSAKQWVEKYFDTHSQAIRKLNQDFETLMKTRLAQKNPDISGSLALLRKLAQDSNN